MTGFQILIALHVLAAALWAGSALFMTLFILPTVARSGAQGGAFMQLLLATNHFPVALGIAGATTILSGFGMFWIISGGFSPSFMRTPAGTMLSIGALCGILAAVMGAITGRMKERGAPFARAAAFLLLCALVLMTVGSHA